MRTSVCSPRSEAGAGLGTADSDGLHGHAGLVLLSPGDCSHQNGVRSSSVSAAPLRDCAAKSDCARTSLNPRGLFAQVVNANSAGIHGEEASRRDDDTVFL